MTSRTLTARKMSTPRFKASKEGLTLLGANAAGVFKLKPGVIYHFKNPRTLENYAKSTMPCSINGTTKLR